MKACMMPRIASVSGLTFVRASLLAAASSALNLLQAALPSYGMPTDQCMHLLRGRHKDVHASAIILIQVHNPQTPMAACREDSMTALPHTHWRIERARSSAACPPGPSLGGPEWPAPGLGSSRSRMVLSGSLPAALRLPAAQAPAACAACNLSCLSSC